MYLPVCLLSLSLNLVLHFGRRLLFFSSSSSLLLLLVCSSLFGLFSFFCSLFLLVFFLSLVIPLLYLYSLVLHRCKFSTTSPALPNIYLLPTH